jgi:Raf kinase inhibitor-like YbhB/YbcL family protein
MQLNHALRSIRSLPHMLLGGVPSERAGEERLAWTQLRVVPSGILSLLCDAFLSGGVIPREFTADGGSKTPPLRFAGDQPRANSYALLVEDPDAPTPLPFVHWLAYGIPPDALTIEEAIRRGAKVGRNSMLRADWAGCAPPKGDSPHRYVFQLFALDQAIDIGEHAGRSALVSAIRQHVVDYATLVGTYQR